MMKIIFKVIVFIVLAAFLGQNCGWLGAGSEYCGLWFAFFLVGVPLIGAYVIISHIKNK